MCFKQHGRASFYIWKPYFSVSVVAETIDRLKLKNLLQYVVREMVNARGLPMVEIDLQQRVTAHLFYYRCFWFHPICITLFDVGGYVCLSQFIA